MHLSYGSDATRTKPSLGGSSGRSMRETRSPKKASDSETRSLAGGRGITHSRFSYEHPALHSCYHLSHPGQAQIVPYITTMPTSHFHYVYILWDAATHSHFYVGHTSDLAARLKTHNAGHVPHTSKYAPWEIHSAIAVQTEEQASELEKYFKSHSGREWALKHLGLK